MNDNTDKSETRAGQRIAKVMARAGLCSRRDAEAWIAAGRVSVNGAALTSPAYNVSDADDVRVDGQRLREPERTRLFFFHKPRGLVTTARDPEGRPTIFDALPPDLPRVVAVGRLDINTEGLLLLTNDGGLARVLELPATGWLRRYRVRAHGEVTQPQLDALREGLTLEGVHYAGIEARLERQQGSNVWLTMGLREGKNREIKRVLEHLGLAVNRLIRVSFGPFELGELGEREVAEVNTRILRDQLGLKLAKQANANFDAPVTPRRPEPPPPPPARRDERRPPDKRGERAPRPPREDKAKIAEELATRGERWETTRPRKRKHVSILRAEARAQSEGPRVRTERGATADRKGREVKVERIVKAREPAQAERRGRGAESDARARFARPGPRTAPPARREGAPAREGRPSGDRPREGRASDDRPRERRPGVDRPREVRPSGDRPREGRPSGDRPREGRPSGDRPREGRPSGDRPREGRPSGDRPREGRPNGDRPREGRVSGDRPRERRPSVDGLRDGRPGGERQREARPTGDRPREGRPSGGRPREGRPPRAGAPGGKPGARPDGRPGGKPGGRPGGRPGGKRPPRKG